MPKHPANNADRFGVVWLCFCAPKKNKRLKIAFFAVRQGTRNPLFWQSQFAPQAPYDEYFCCLSCPSTLPTVLIVLVWFGCVSVLQIARTKLKITFFANLPSEIAKSNGFLKITSSILIFIKF